MNMILETVTKAIKPKTKIESDQAKRQKIQAEFALLGVLECPPEILDRFMILEEHSNSEFFRDSRMVREGFRNVVNTLESRGMLELTQEQRAENYLAAFVHDIGKSSSSEDPSCQAAVAKLFSRNNIDDPKQTVGKTLEEYFSSEMDEMTSSLSKVGVTADMRMRDFWDKHAPWTKEILEKYPEIFNGRTRIIAASHHIDRGINPCGIDENMVLTGESQAMDDELLGHSVCVLMAIDKYQARTSRGEATHKEAMQYLRHYLKKYKKNLTMTSILLTIDELGKAGTLFSESPERD